MDPIDVFIRAALNRPGPPDKWLDEILEDLKYLPSTTPLKTIEDRHHERCRWMTPDTRQLDRLTQPENKAVEADAITITDSPPSSSPVQEMVVDPPSRSEQSTSKPDAKIQILEDIRIVPATNEDDIQLLISKKGNPLQLEKVVVSYDALKRSKKRRRRVTMRDGTRVKVKLLANGIIKVLK